MVNSTQGHTLKSVLACQQSKTLAFRSLGVPRWATTSLVAEAREVEFTRQPLITHYQFPTSEPKTTLSKRIRSSKPCRQLFTTMLSPELRLLRLWVGVQAILHQACKYHLLTIAMQPVHLSSRITALPQICRLLQVHIHTHRATHHLQYMAKICHLPHLAQCTRPCQEQHQTQPLMATAHRTWRQHRLLDPNSRTSPAVATVVVDYRKPSLWIVLLSVKKWTQVKTIKPTQRTPPCPVHHPTLALSSNLRPGAWSTSPLPTSTLRLAA